MGGKFNGEVSGGFHGGFKTCHGCLQRASKRFTGISKGFKKVSGGFRGLHKLSRILREVGRVCGYRLVTGVLQRLFMGVPKGIKMFQSVSVDFTGFGSFLENEKFWGYYSGFKAFQWDFRTLQKVSVIHFIFFKDLKLRSLVRV